MSRTFRRINSKHILDQKLDKLKNKYFSNMSDKIQSEKIIIESNELLNYFFRDSFKYREKRGCICLFCAADIVCGKKYKIRNYSESFSKKKIYEMACEYYDLLDPFYEDYLEAREYYTDDYAGYDFL